MTRTKRRNKGTGMLFSQRRGATIFLEVKVVAKIYIFLGIRMLEEWIICLEDNYFA